MTTDDQRLIEDYIPIAAIFNQAWQGKSRRYMLILEENGNSRFG